MPNEDLPTTQTLRARLGVAVPAVRLLVVALAILGGVSVYVLGGTGLWPLLLLPSAAVATDLAFQWVRFPRRRIPEPAIATGLFLALLLPPTVALGPAVAVAVLAVGLRHSLRRRGRPWFNPAATGVVLGAVLFGMAPAWWVTVTPLQEVLVLGLGLLLVARSAGTWRWVGVFFGMYVVLMVLQHDVFGGSVPLRVVLLETVDPSVLFFGLFMLSEPRTAPRDPASRPLYAAVVGGGAALLPLVFPSLGILLALLLGNVLLLALPSPSGSSAPRKSIGKVRPTIPSGSSRWSVGRRVGAVAALLLFVGLIAASPLTPHNVPPVPLISGSGTAPGGTGGGGSTAVTCAHDNPSIASSTLSMLHQRLGPSVILQYDANSGVTVFYDPVNQVTVTETDLYEDYGFAEFNGDDGAASGCVP